MKEPDITGQLVPAETKSVPQIAVNPETPPVAVTDQEADEAAKSLGMTYFNAAKTRKLKTIGMFRAQQGVVHLGVGRLAACDEALQKLIDTAVAIASDEREETSDRNSALMAGKGLIDTMQKGVQMEAEFQVEKLIGGVTGGRKRSFDQMDQPIIPIQAQQVNINVDSPKPTGEAKPV